MAQKPTYSRQHKTINNKWTQGQIIEASLLNDMQDQIAQNTQGFSNIVSYSDTQPSGDYSQYNQIWLKKTRSAEDSIKLAEVKDLDKVVIVSQNQPNDNINKLWIKDSGPASQTITQVPSFDEFSQSIENNIAPSYLNSATYEVGEYVTYDNKLYMCQTAVTTPNEWNVNSNHFIEASVAGPLGYDDPTKGGWPNINASILNKIEEESDSRIQVQNKVNNIENSIAPIYTNKTYNIGDYCTKDGYLYKCNTTINAAEAWTAAHWTQVTASGEVSDLKSIIDSINDDLQYKNGEAQSLPITTNNSVDVTLSESGKIFNGNGNFMDLFNITDGTYTVNSLEIVVSRHGSRISFNGTASAAGYMMLSDNTGASSGNLNRGYDLPLLPVTFYVKKVSGSQSTVSTTLNIRKDSTSNYFSIGLTNDITTVSRQISNNEHCRELYLYFNKNSTYNNFVIDLALGYTNTTGTTPNTTIVEGETASISSNGVVTATVSGTAIETVRFDFEDTMARIESLEAKTAKNKCFVQYRNDLSNEYATEGLYIYLPSKKGYIRQQFVHSVRQEVNADNWRMGFVYACDDALNPETQITTSGEWECAVKLSGRADFSGGIAHGDEVGTELIVFLDGEIAQESVFTNITAFDELRIVTVSNLYDPDDGTTVVAIHGCERIYSKDGIVVNQTIKWLNDLTVTSCYLAMFPVVKAVTNKYFTDENYTETNIPTNHSQVIVGRARKSTIYSEDAGFTSEFNTPIYPTEYTNGNYFLIADNGTDNYNKCYYAITNSSGSVNYEIPANTVWKTQAVYKMSMS